MPFSLSCPHCQSNLRTALALPVGKKVPCPKCGETITISAENMKEIAASRSIAASNNSTSSGSKPARALKPSSPPDSLDRENEQPEELSRSRQDDEPESARRSRRSRDDEEDEAPRRSSRRSDDEDDQPRRSSSRSRRKKKSNQGVIIGLIVGGVAVIGLVVFLIIRASGRGGSEDTAKTDQAKQGSGLNPVNTGGSSIPVRSMIKFIPQDAAVVILADINGLLQNNQVQNLIAPFTAMIQPKLQEVGLQQMEDIGFIMIAGPPDNLNNNSGNVIYINLKRKYDKNILIKSGKIVAVAPDVYKVGSDAFLAFISDHEVLVCQKKATVQKELQLLNSNAAPQLQNQAFFNLIERSSKNSISIIVSSAFKQSKEFGSAFRDMPNDLRNFQAADISLNLVGDRLQLKSTMVLNDPTSAGNAAIMLRQMINQINTNPMFGQQMALVPGMQGVVSELMGSVQINNTGNELSMSMSASFSSIVNTLKSVMDSMPRNPTMPPKIGQGIPYTPTDPRFQPKR